MNETPVDGLERLYREQGKRLWWSLLAFAGDPEVASDAMSEAFAQALRRGEAIRAPDRVGVAGRLSHRGR